LKLRALILLAGLALAATAQADERIVVCYNYGCAAEAPVRYTEAQLVWARKAMGVAKNAEQERKVLGPVIGRLYYWAGQQTPIYADRGGNYLDDALPGSMDCIDHSTTTTRLLTMMERLHMLNFHRVLQPAKRTRFFMFDHFSAVIEELPPNWLPHAKIRHEEDSWFVDNGKPAVILPLEDWKDGAGPDVEPD
jgi:hypothetical protein